MGGGGAPTVLAAMEPVFFGRRLRHLALGAGGILGTGVLFAIGWMLLAHSDSDDAGQAVVAIIAGIGACFWVAWRTAKKLVASVQVERLGEDEGFFS